MVLYFDIGANVGKWSMENASSADKIVAVEASPQTYDKMLNFVTAKNVECINYAICNNKNEDVTFYHSTSDTLSSLNKNWFEDDRSRFYGVQKQAITCHSLTLDAMIDKYGVPDLIKIDVELGEYECISSLSSKVPCLCYEWASEFNDITIKCLNHLKDLGFDKFYLQFEDCYTFRPMQEDFCTHEEIVIKLSKTIPKNHWGMIWCK